MGVAVGAGDRLEIDVVNLLGAVAVDQIEEGAAIPATPGFPARLGRVVYPNLGRAPFGGDTQRLLQSRTRKAMPWPRGRGLGEVRGLAGRLHVEDEVDVAPGISRRTFFDRWLPTW
jgi:hypothetical protein